MFLADFYRFQTTAYQFLLSLLIKGFVKINKWALLFGFILGIIGSRILYMSDNDGNLVVTSFCVLLATILTHFVQAVVRKISSKSN